MIGNIVLSLLLPWLILCLFLILDDADKKPKFEIDSNGVRHIKKRIGTLGKEMPTAFLSNIVWGFTLHVEGISQDCMNNFKAFYYIITFVQILLIAFVRTKKFSRHINICFYIYWGFLIISFVLLSISTFLLLKYV